MRRTFTISLVLLFLVLSTLAFAEKKTTITISDPVRVANTTLKAGDYQVVWNENQPNTTVTFKRDGKVVATAPAKVEEKPNPYNGALMLKTAPDGSRVLSGIQLSQATIELTPESQPEGR